MESHEIWQGGPRPELRPRTGVRGVAATAVTSAQFQHFSPTGADTFFMWHAAVDLEVPARNAICGLQRMRPAPIAP